MKLGHIRFFSAPFANVAIYPLCEYVYGYMCGDGYLHVNIYILIHYRQKIWNIFYFSDFLHFCGMCRVFLYLKYIPPNRYYFWGANKHLAAKGSAKVQKQLFRYFSQSDYCKNSCWPLVSLLPYPFVCCIEILCTIPLFIYCLFWCGQPGISVVGASHTRAWGVVLVYHKVMYTKS